MLAEKSKEDGTDRTVAGNIHEVAGFVGASAYTPYSGGAVSAWPIQRTIPYAYHSTAQVFGEVLCTCCTCCTCCTVTSRPSTLFPRFSLATGLHV